jgi:two-component system, cell cycle response regulator
MTAASSTSSTPRPRVLFADGSSLMRKAAIRILGAEFDVVLAENLEQAWVALQDDELVQAVFCDLSRDDRTPDLTLIEHIRSAGSRRIRETPIVLMTDDDHDESVRERALDLGVNDFIARPFRPSELIARARSHATANESIQRLRQLESRHDKDDATGLGNRRYFFERLGQALSFARRHQQPLSLVHVHLDGLSQPCEQLDQRQVGERMAKLGRVLGRSIRHEDTVYRTGPETFSFILPGTDAAGAETVRCRLLPELDAMGMLDASRTPPVQGRFIVQSPNLDPDEPLVVSLRQIRESMGNKLVSGEPKQQTGAAVTSRELDELFELARHGDGEALCQRLPEVLDRLRPLLELASEPGKLNPDSPTR